MGRNKSATSHKRNAGGLIMSASTILANYRGEDINDYSTTKVNDYVKIDTGGHGYLCLGSTDNGYSEALRIARASNYSYILDGGLVYLEEDCDATEFLKLMEKHPELGDK
jgi:hypothetical protein